MEPGFHCVSGSGGFMAFEPDRRIRIVMLMVPT
jgi:hypothetical protein